MMSLDGTTVTGNGMAGPHPGRLGPGWLAAGQSGHSPMVLAKAAVMRGVVLSSMCCTT